MAITIKEEDLVLKVSPSYNPSNFDIGKYDNFIDRLCLTREYQKNAIKETCKYLLWWRYSSLSDLAQENYNNNPILREKYPSFHSFENELKFASKLSCSIDLATGTGKSYAIYGIAQIMLCEWKIDRVLVLAPSVTIREWLFDKFKTLSSDKDLKDLLPEWSSYLNPKIIHADGTLEEGSICIENIHTTYKNNKSSIGDSLFQTWERTLVLNDEAHHIYSKANADVKKWFEFLNDPDFGFKYLVWFTGTPYTDNEYFQDVIYRYGILQGIEEKFIKSVDYIKDTDKRLDAQSRMQLVLKNHYDFSQKYPLVKPITIFISKDIEHCKRDRNEIIEFLHAEQGVSREELENKVLIVTSSAEHEKNLEILKHVWEKSNPIEWICSVAMLTEGWDVPNVFQIVPSEERAFNSKLLISQVIWRGLRIPQEYKWENIAVTVLNHTKFKDNIIHLVDEILEKDQKISAYPVESKKEYSFLVYNLEYDESQITQAKSDDYKAPVFWDSFTLFSDDEEQEYTITYGTLGTTEENEKKVILRKDVKTIEEVTLEIYNKIQAWCTELQDDIDSSELEKLEAFDKVFIRSHIQKILDKKGLDNQKISKENAQRILQWFGIIKRFWSKNVRYEKEAKDVKELDIYNQESWIWKASISVDKVKRWNAFIFYDEKSKIVSLEEDKSALNILEEEAWRKFFIEVSNSFLHKTPFNITIASSTPEKVFIEMLISQSNQKLIDGFFKSKDKGFYDFKYRWTGGNRTPKEWKFNPDFFIKSGSYILVIEIKWKESEKEYSRSFSQNKAKFSQAKKHFEELNKKLKEKWINQKYVFSFCSPNDYKTLFKYLEKWNIEKFTSRLEATFEDSILKDNAVKLLEFFDDSHLRDTFWVSWETLEEQSKVFLSTAEKNYFDNKENKNYNFSWGELIKAFELELRNKIFDKIRDNEDISLDIISEEEWKENMKRNTKAIDYFNYSSEFLDLWAMEKLLSFNSKLQDYISKNFSNFDFQMWVNWTNKNFMKNEEFSKLKEDIYKDLPNLIALIRVKYRNGDMHGEKVIKIEEFEELRDIMIFRNQILIKLEKISI